MFKLDIEPYALAKIPFLIGIIEFHFQITF